MSLSPAVIDALVEAGATVAQLAAAVKADMREAEERANAKRAKDAERQRRSRASRSVTVTPRDCVDVPPNDNNSNPPAGDKSPAKRASFDLPDWVPEAEWADFDEMRRAMPKVPWRPAAKRGVIAELDRLRGVGHCPAKLLRKAVTRGWRTVFPGDDTLASSRANGKPAAPLTAEEAEKLAAFHAMRGDHDKAERVRREATGPPRSLGQLAGSIVARVDHGQA